MQAYRVQFFDIDGRVAHVHAMICDHDDDAIERAARLRHKHVLEVWEAERLVWRFDPRATDGE